MCGVLVQAQNVSASTRLTGIILPVEGIYVQSLESQRALQVPSSRIDGRRHSLL